MSKPFHVLLLPGGSKSSLRGGDGTSHDDRGDEDVDDYLSRRNKFRKNDASRNRVGISQVDSSADQSLRILASKLEIAIAACCERRDNADGPSLSSSNHPRHRSGLHRPLFPSNYVAPESTLSSSMPSPDRKRYENEHANYSVILQSGKEGHLLKLLVMYCPKHAVGHRALAIAVLQRTVDWESSNCDTDPKNIRAMSMQSKRAKSFLEAGGMKLLAQWLVDSYTVVRAPANQMGQDNKHSHPQRVASPTGCLLLPLLYLLKDIPFDKKLVVASQINKSIKRLKKALGTLVKGLDPDTLDKEVHPISGGLSVGKVISAVDEVMSSWTKASAEADMVTNSGVNFDPFHKLRKEIQSRFVELAKYQNGEGDPENEPEWLPKSMRIRRIGAAVGKSASQSHASHTGTPPSTGARKYHYSSGKKTILLKSKAKTGQDNKTLRELFAKKRDGVAMMLENSKAGRIRKRKISWADRPIGPNKIPRPLREERIFVRDPNELKELFPVLKTSEDGQRQEGADGKPNSSNTATEKESNGDGQRQEGADGKPNSSNTATEEESNDQHVSHVSEKEQGAIAPSAAGALSSEGHIEGAYDQDDSDLEDLF